MAMFSTHLAYRSLKLDEAAWRTAQHVLHLDASHGATSVVSHGVQAVFAELARTCPALRVEHLRLWDDATRTRMEYNLEHVRLKMAMVSGNTSQEDVKAYTERFANIEALAKQLASARGLVISVPMWNYGAPYVLKQYFDCVLHPGLTFRERPGATPEGLLGGGRPLLIVTSSGGAAANDHLTPWLRDLGTMLGFDDMAVVAAPNVAQGDRQATLDDIVQEATQAARNFGRGASEAATGCTAAALPVDSGGEDGEGHWDDQGLLRWLRAQGGLSKDCLESVQAARVDGQLFSVATAEDWRNEEMGLEDDDVARIMELQQHFCNTIGDRMGAGPSSDR